MKFEIKYDAGMAGAKIVYSPASGAENWATDFRNSAYFGTPTVGAAYVLTGYYWMPDNDYAWLQTTSGLYVSAHFDGDGVQNWTYYKDAVVLPSYNVTQAQALVDQIIKNNRTIICNNLLCARYASKLTEAQKEQVRALQLRLQARNNALQAEELTSNVQTSYPAGYAELSAYLDALMAGNAIGIATWVVVVIAATVIAATATAAYFAYKRLADESEADVKFSKELTRSLTSKLTEEEYQQLLNETKGIVTKSRIKQMLSDYGKWVGIAAALVGGMFLYKFLRNN